MRDKLVSIINNSDTSGFVLKTKYDTDKKIKLMVQTNKYLTLKIYFKKKQTINAKISEIEGKIPSINDLATSALLAAVQNKIPDGIGLIKKQIMTQKIVKLNRSNSIMSSKQLKRLF